MGWRCCWATRCERCGATGPLGHTSLEAEGLALAAGWQKGRNGSLALHVCPACAALGLPSWWPDGTRRPLRWEAG